MHPSAGLAAQARKRGACRAANAIDHAFHYASPRQAELWQAVHAAHSPAQGDRKVLGIYSDFVLDEVAFFPNAPHVISLGCGGSVKDRLILETMEGQGCPASRFTPQDVSPGLALLSAEACKGLSDTKSIKPIVGDLLEMEDLASWLDVTDGEVPRLYTAFGLLPNFEPGAFLPWLARLLRPEDAALLSANLAPVTEEEDATGDMHDYRRAVERILPQYDNPETREWLTRVLHDWGWEEEVVLDGYSMDIKEADGLLRFEATVPWRAGGRLRLFFSNRYTPARLKTDLSRHGLLALDCRVAPNREEGIWLVHKART